MGVNNLIDHFRHCLFKPSDCSRFEQAVPKRALQPAAEHAKALTDRKSASSVADLMRDICAGSVLQA